MKLIRYSSFSLLVAFVATTLGCIGGSTDQEAWAKASFMSQNPSRPLWMGAIQPMGSNSIHGAAAITEGDSPKSSHVMVSIAGATPDQRYPWTLKSGKCTDKGSTVSSSKFPPLQTLPDGSAAAELMIAGTLTPNQTYSVTISQVQNDNQVVVACSALTFGKM
jgi:hypothetical protein